VNNGNEVYRFSPQRTSKDKVPLPQKPKETASKIKLKPTPRQHTSKPEPKSAKINLFSCSKESSKADIIRI
jgi:hypothetical protein